MNYDLGFKILFCGVLAAWLNGVEADCMTVQSDDMVFINCDNGYNSTIIRSGDLILDSHGNSAIILDDEDRPLQDYLIIDDWDTETDEELDSDWLED